MSQPLGRHSNHLTNSFKFWSAWLNVDQPTSKQISITKKVTNSVLQPQNPTNPITTINFDFSIMISGVIFYKLLSYLDFLSRNLFDISSNGINVFALIVTYTGESMKSPVRPFIKSPQHKYTLPHIPRTVCRCTWRQTNTPFSHSLWNGCS